MSIFLVYLNTQDNKLNIAKIIFISIFCVILIIYAIIYIKFTQYQFVKEFSCSLYEKTQVKDW